MFFSYPYLSNLSRLSLIAILLCLAMRAMGQKISITMADTYQRHTELRWKVEGVSGAEYFKIMKSSDGHIFAPVKTITDTLWLDFTSTDALDTSYYFVEALSGLNHSLAKSDTILVSERNLSDNELMDMVQRYTFRYFYDEAHPVSGLARERNTSGDIVTTGGSGFGIMGILVGVENGYITRTQGAQRLIKIIGFLQYADKFHGVFPHWMNGKTGKVVPFSQYDDGGDLVETAFLMQGLLAARQFFDAPNSTETAIRQAITKLYNDVEWDFYSRNNSGVLYWHWSPKYNWQMNFPLRGYNEAMIVYLLAIASPSHPIPASYYHSGWASSATYKNGNTWFGHKLFVGPAYGGPLFFAHYSFLGFDPRNIKDKYTNYFENNRNHTLINRGWCIYNPLKFKSYSENCWGLTASDNPTGYLAHAPGSTDNGTIAPTAALSSMPYTPNESMAALKHFYLVEGASLFGINGFFDAFNPTKNWVASSYLAIDQGPILVMMQNFRTGLLWRTFMSNPEIKPALDAIGFIPDIIATEDDKFVEKCKIFPNPTSGSIHLKFEGDLPQKVEVFDFKGQKVVDQGVKTSREIVILSWQTLPGIYVVKLQYSEKQMTRLVVVK